MGTGQGKLEKFAIIRIVVSTFISLHTVDTLSFHMEHIMAGINKLLKNESKIMLFILAGPFVIGLVLVFLLPLFYQENQIDTCLDAGGSFNYKECTCDFNKSHIVPRQHTCK